LSRDEVLPEPGAPCVCVRRGVRDRFEIEFSCVRAAYQNRKRIFETERWADLDVKLVCVFLFDLVVDGPRISDGLVVQYCRVRRAGVFGVKIESAADERIVRKIPAEFETTLDGDAARFEHLRDDLCEQRGFSEVFRADDDAVCVSRIAARSLPQGKTAFEQQDYRNGHENDSPRRHAPAFSLP